LCWECQRPSSHGRSKSFNTPANLQSVVHARYD
jgi:hypothetical protein